MVTYTVHEPAEATADRVDRGAELRFVKDGFSWITALFPPFGLAASQLWLPLVAYIVFVGVGAVALSALGVSENWISLAMLALHIFMGFEHSTLQRWTLDNAGWNMLGTVTGKSLDECERRFFESWLPGQPMISQPSAAAISAGGERVAQSVVDAWRARPDSSMQRVVIIDYGSGNLHSAAKAFERAAREGEARCRNHRQCKGRGHRGADRVVLPGVGAYADCKRGLDAVPGLLETLDEVVRKKARPFLGICVGMQLLSERGLEHGVSQGLGWIKGDVRAIEPNDLSLKIPHMGWNTLDVVTPHALLDGIQPGRTACTRTSCIPTIWRQRSAASSWLKPATADR